MPLSETESGSDYFKHFKLTTLFLKLNNTAKRNETRTPKAPGFPVDATTLQCLRTAYETHQ